MAILIGSIYVLYVWLSLIFFTFLQNPNKQAYNRGWGTKNSLSLALQQTNARMFIAHISGIHNKEAPDKINLFINAFVVSKMK